MTDQTPADELRAAAILLRELADRAIHEDRTNWFPGNTLGSKSPVVVDDPEEPSVLIETYAARLEAVNRYIAAMDPGLGRALAGWLEWMADECEQQSKRHRLAPVTPQLPDGADHALAVARQILGTQET